MMIKTLLMGVLIAMGAMIGAPTANAGPSEFIDFLVRNGEDMSGTEVQYAAIDYGLAICNLYRVSQSNDHVVTQMLRNGEDNISAYTVGSVLHLCPEWRYLLP
jgi:hypothetical protein